MARGEKRRVGKKKSGVLVHSFFEKKHVELSSLFFQPANFFMNAAPTIDGRDRQFFNELLW